jgi:hypothetical protein
MIWIILSIVISTLILAAIFREATGVVIVLLGVGSGILITVGFVGYIAWSLIAPLDWWWQVGIAASVGALAVAYVAVVAVSIIRDRRKWRALGL